MEERRMEKLRKEVWGKTEEIREVELGRAKKSRSECGFRSGSGSRSLM
jgi:hypothetical protein